MTNDRHPDFAWFCMVFKAWRAEHGLSQADVRSQGGPSAPIQKEIEALTWTAARPEQTLRKVDAGFGWPQGTARRVLFEHYDPSDDPAVTGAVGAARQAGAFVKGQGATTEPGVTNEDLLSAIIGMRAEYDQLRAGQDDLRRGLDSLSERVAQIEQQDT